MIFYFHIFYVSLWYKKQFKIIGLYDNKKTINMNNECYVTSKDLIEIMDKNYLNVNDNTLYSQYAVINKLENVNKTISYLKENGFNMITLSEEGKKQIEAASKDVRLQKADLIITSPYGRTLHTAAILSRNLGLEIVVETDFGMLTEKK